jgi:hypothetical protein
MVLFELLIVDKNLMNIKVQALPTLSLQMRKSCWTGTQEEQLTPFQRKKDRQPVTKFSGFNYSFCRRLCDMSAPHFFLPGPQKRDVYNCSGSEVLAGLQRGGVRISILHRVRYMI